MKIHSTCFHFMYIAGVIMCQEEPLLSTISFKGDKSKFLQLLPTEDEEKLAGGSSYQKDQDWPMENEIVEYLKIQTQEDNLISDQGTISDPKITMDSTPNPTDNDETSEPIDNGESSDPTSSPTNISSPSPTGNPTPNPTANPTPKPSQSPTEIPTRQPSNLRTNNPTKSYPTIQPSYEKYDGYFDYKEESDYGPDHWRDVDAYNSEYLQFFEKDDNECSGPEQSPIDVEPNTECPDDHKINYKNGRPKFDTIDFKILPHVLRAYMQQVPMYDDDGAIYLGARADFSNLSEYVPAQWVDVKVPSEHYLFGKQYAGEMNIAHYFDYGRGRMIFITILMDDENDEINEKLELFIKEWEETAKEKKAECNGEQYKRTYFPPNDYELRKIWEMNDNQKGNWDLYRFATTTYHCGYEGSITEPPCSERAIYRVLDLPMQMSKDQTKRLNDLLLQTPDQNCNRPNIADANGGVNRPLQTDNDNSVYCCTSDDWPLKWEQEYWLSKWPENYHGRDNIFDYRKKKN